MTDRSFGDLSSAWEEIFKGWCHKSERFERPACFNHLQLLHLQLLLSAGEEERVARSAAEPAEGGGWGRHWAWESVNKHAAWGRRELFCSFGASEGGAEAIGANPNWPSKLGLWQHVFWQKRWYQGGGGGEGEHVRGQGEDDTPEGWTFLNINSFVRTDLDLLWQKVKVKFSQKVKLNMLVFGWCNF